MAEPLAQSVDRFGRARRQHLDAAVATIVDDAVQSEAAGMPSRRGPKPHSLHDSENAEPGCNPRAHDYRFVFAMLPASGFVAT